MGGLSGWRLATLHGKRAGAPPGQGGAPEAETIKQPAASGLLEIRTLSGWGARYTEKKARREVSDSAVLGLGFLLRYGSRILRVVVAKKPDVVGLFDARGFRGKARFPPRAFRDGSFFCCVWP